MSKNLYHCEKCNYSCARKFLWNQHLRSKKHNTNIKKIIKYVCEVCDMEFNTRQALHKHKKTCKEDVGELVKKLLDENKKLTDTIQTIKPNVVNNNTFNLNVFLNESCKDAVNFSDFINSLQVQLPKLDCSGSNSFSEVISNMFVNNLRSLEITKRPIHCSGSKRETLLIKHNDEWLRENAKTKEQMKKAIHEVNKKQLKKLGEVEKSEDDYLNLVTLTMGPANEKDMEKEENKIIKTIAKEVLLEKI